MSRQQLIFSSEYECVYELIHTMYIHYEYKEIILYMCNYLCTVYLLNKVDFVCLPSKFVKPQKLKFSTKDNFLIYIILIKNLA